MYILKILRAIKKITIKEIKDFIFEKFYRRIEFPKENNYHLIKYQKEKGLLLLATKLIEKILDANNAKEYYNYYLKKKKYKIDKTIEDKYSATNDCTKLQHG